MENKQCIYCKKEFSSNGKIYCTRECYNNAKRAEQKTLICSFCNKEFSVSKKRSEEVKHCSRKCYIAAANKSGLRVCKDCNQLKPIEEFRLHTQGKDIRRRYCLSCEKNRVKIRSKLPKERWASAKRRASKYNEIWEVSLEIFAALISQQCHYCGGPLNPTGCGLDRKDNNEGYTEINVVPCCRQCNIVKNSFFTYDEMNLLAPALKKIREERNAHGE